MKKIILCLFWLVASIATMSQQTNSPPMQTQQDFLKKSKNQKTIAWILLGTGTAMMITGSIIWSNAVEDRVENDPWEGLFAPYTTTEGTTVTAIGLVVSAGSIPLFIVSRKNKRKAMSLSAGTRTFPQLGKTSLVKQTIPSLTLKIQL